MSTRYIGKLCAKHPELGGERWVSGDRCTQCLRESKAKYRAKNAEKLSESRKRYYTENADTERSKRRAYYDANQETERMKATAWHAENRERSRANSRTWRSANPDRKAFLEARRKATKQMATPQWANSFFIEEAYRLAKLREQLCGGEWHVDHTVPLRSKRVCGLHCEANLRVIPGPENVQKGNRYWPDMP